MRTRLIVAAIAVLLGLMQVAWAADAPGFELDDLDGDEYTLEDLLDECDLLVIAFWEYGCVPCTKQLMRLQEYYDEYQEERIEFVVISSTTSMFLNKVEPFFSSNEFTFRVLLDVDKEVSKDYKVEALPASFVVDTDGKLLLQQYTYKLGDEEAIEEIIVDFLADRDDSDDEDEDYEPHAGEDEGEEEE